MNRKQIIMTFVVVSSFLLALGEPTTNRALFAQTPPPTNIIIPEDATPVKVDARCDPTEYGKALELPYTDTPGQTTDNAVIYVKHDADNVYLCIQGTVGTLSGRFFGVYLDTSDDRATFPQKDDFSLRIGVAKNVTSTFQGTGIATAGPYLPVSLAAGLWEAAASTGNEEVAEYRIARDLVSPICSNPFGLAIYHQQVDDLRVDYGVPNGRFYNTPSTWLQATLANPRCVRVLSNASGELTPAIGAIVHRTADGAQYTVDSNGYVIHGSRLANGNALWATLPITATSQATVYYTSGDPAIVSDAAFATPGTMTLIVTPQKPLMVHDLDISTQWYVEGDPNRAAWLRANLVHAANFLYAFTNGQFTLGKVRIQQSYDGWDTTNFKLHVNNTFQPRANIGGVVLTDTVDLSPSVLMTYTPGSIYMGSYWNRYGKPPNELILDHGSIVPTTTMQLDWSLALAHELGHYLLFQFDSYTGVDGKASQELAKTCTGSAMGDVYEPGNQRYIADALHWSDKCSGTEAYHVLGGRTEWQTIQLWYPWTIVASAAVTGPVAPPINLTNVTFVPPSTPPGTLAASQIFNLNYQDQEQSSGEARAFILRNDRVYEQGKPPKNATQIELIDAELGDRLCVYDINDHAEGSETPRHQFGCELIKPNDADLAMTKNNAWGPLVRLQQTGPQQLTLAMTQPVTSELGAAVMVQLYPEDGVAYPPAVLTGSGGVYTGVLNLPNPVSPVYAQIWVNETPTDPATRREVILDRGTGGSGAFGPAKMLGGVLVVSSDGNASFEGDQPLELGPGQSIAWQSMPGTPALPVGKQIIGQSYRLDAYPASLVASGKVHIQYQELASLVQAATVGQPGSAEPVIHFWDGRSWQPLTTTISTPASTPDGVRLATAPSQGVGVYAVLVEPVQHQIFLPVIERREP